VYIHEVVKQALETGKRFRRADDFKEAVNFEVAGEASHITIISLGAGKFPDKSYPYWNPRTDDLMADNWELCEK